MPYRCCKPLKVAPHKLYYMPLTRNQRMTSISDMSREDLLTMIRNTIRDEIQAVVKQEVSDRLDRFEQQLTQLSALQQQMGDVSASIHFISKKLEGLKSSSLPALYSHVGRIAEALAMQTLDLDMHRRKWSLTINGIKGASDEDDVDTRNACVQLARDHLGIPDADPNDLAACHRLARKEDVGIILRFRDLSRRNECLFGAKNLKGHSDAISISISPDVPPVLRAVKRPPPEEKGLCHRLTGKLPTSATRDNGRTWNLLWGKTEKYVRTSRQIRSSRTP